MDWLVAVKNFTKVAEKRNFSAVARERYTSPSAITKQINWLEDQVGQTLLQRSTRNVELTSAGERFYQYAQNFLQETAIIKKQLQNEEDTMTGRLAITAPKFFGEDRVASIVVKFAQRYPCLDIEFNTVNRLVDLAEENYDIAIRSIFQKDSRYQTTSLISVQRCIFASPSYLQKYGIPQYPNELIRFNCITNLDFEIPTIWNFKNDKYFSIKSKLSFNSATAQLEAAVAGLGLIYTTYYRVQQYLDAGQLVPVLENYMPKPLQLRAVYRKMSIITKKITRFVQFMQEQLRITDET